MGDIALLEKDVSHVKRDKKTLRDIFSWKEKYQIGYYTIDVEHKKLFDIAMKALDYNIAGVDTKKHIKDIISELYDYMRIHAIY